MTVAGPSLPTAMRYYRLWIYTSNLVLLLGVLVFVATAGVVLTDSRRQLVTEFKFYQPSVVYAYMAIFMQSGVVQMIGCLGAVRLNEKLLNAYWAILFGLLVGDFMVGGMWLYKMDTVIASAKIQISERFAKEYTNPNSEFRALWNEIQRESQCCGVQDPLDYNISWWQNKMFRSLDKTDEDEMAFEKTEDILLPWSCCVPGELGLHEPEAMANTIRQRLLEKSQAEAEEENAEKGDGSSDYPGLHIGGVGGDDHHGLHGEHDSHKSTPPPTLHEYSPEVMIEEGPIIEPDTWCRYSSSYRAGWHHHTGCEVKIVRWIEDSADNLLVIGFCVIGFIKLTFLALLRVEIKEMIQKIKNLQNESEVTLNGDLAIFDLGNSSSLRGSIGSKDSANFNNNDPPPQQTSGLANCTSGNVDRNSVFMNETDANKKTLFVETKGSITKTSVKEIPFTPGDVQMQVNNTSAMANNVHTDSNNVLPNNYHHSIGNQHVSGGNAAVAEMTNSKYPDDCDSITALILSNSSPNHHKPQFNHHSSKNNARSPQPPSTIPESPSKKSDDVSSSRSQKMQRQETVVSNNYKGNSQLQTSI